MICDDDEVTAYLFGFAVMFWSVLLIGVWLMAPSNKEKASVNQDFLTQSCIEANPYKSPEDCIRQSNQIHMILTKEKR